MRKLLTLVLVLLAGPALGDGRDPASGVYTLPAVGTGGWTNPVVAGTRINADWANTTMGSIRDALTDSLSRTGAGGMQAPLKLYSGTNAAPGLAFGLESSTGLYLIGPADVALSVAGTKRQEWNGSTATVTGNLTVTGAHSAASVAATGNVTVGGTLGVTGVATMNSNATVGGTLGVTGAATLSGGLTLTGQLTRANLPTVNQQVGPSCGDAGWASASMYELTTCTVTITTTGRPVLVLVEPDGSTNPSGFSANQNTVSLYLWLKRGGQAGTTLGYWQESLQATGLERIPFSAVFLDVVGPGTYTYSLMGYAQPNSVGTVKLSYVRIVAYEL